MMKYILFLALLLTSAAPAQTTVHTAVELQQAITTSAPGTTILVAPGVYQGRFTATANGIEVQGAGATIDGYLLINGSDTTWRDFEVQSTAWLTRTSAYAGSNPADVPRTGVEVFGPRTNLYGFTVHDVQNAFAFWTPAADSRIENCLTYNIGWRSKIDGAHGRALYVQNRDGRKTIKNCAILDGYNMTQVNVYTDGGWLNGITLDGLFTTGHWIFGGGGPVKRGEVLNSVTMGGPVVNLGYGNPNNEDIRIEGNTFGSILDLWGFKTITMTNNLHNQQPWAIRMHTPVSYTYAIDDNEYTTQYLRDDAPNWLGVNNVAVSVANWQARGWDTNGLFRNSTLDYTRAIVHPLQESAGRIGMIAVLNPTKQATVTADLAPLGLISGEAYRLINAHNPAENLVFVAGASLPIPMNRWTMAIPYGDTKPLRTWDSRFAVFVVAP